MKGVQKATLLVFRPETWERYFQARIIVDLEGWGNFSIQFQAHQLDHESLESWHEVVCNRDLYVHELDVFDRAVSYMYAGKVEFNLDYAEKVAPVLAKFGDVTSLKGLIAKLKPIIEYRGWGGDPKEYVEHTNNTHQCLHNSKLVKTLEAKHFEALAKKKREEAETLEA